jgi:hypothetical protein
MFFGKVILSASTKRELMAQLFPFRAYRYNPAKTDPARVLTQPYDKITPEMQKRYAAAIPTTSSPSKRARCTKAICPATSTRAL